MKLSLLLWLFLVSACGSLAHATLISAEPSEALHLREGHSLDEDACPPSTIVNLPITINGNTSTSASNYTLSCPYYLPATGPDDIYAISLSCRTQVTVSLCGSSYDTVVEVRRGPNFNYFDCPGSIVLDCNDDYCGTQSQVSFFADIGEFYFIIVSGYNGSSGAYTMNVTGVTSPPLNDNCPGFTINSLPYNDFGSTTCASAGSYFQPPCVNSYTGGVVYTLDLPCAAYVTATTCGHPTMDAVLSVRTGGNCPGTTPVVCNDDACADYQSSVSFNAYPNTPYYIFVDGWGTNRGYYVLSVTGSTGPGECPGDYIIQFPVSITGDTRCANNILPLCIGGTSNFDVYTFNVQQCTQVTATMCGTDNLLFDPVIEIRRGPSCPGDAQVICADDGTCDGAYSLSPTVTFTADPSTVYYIMVAGYGGTEGAYNLYVTGDPCSTPPAVTDLVAHAVPEISVIELTWSPVIGASYYNVYSSANDCNPTEPCHLLASTQGTSFSDDAGLGGPENVRFYQVRAENSGQPPLLTRPGKQVPPQPNRVARDFVPLVPYDYSASAQKPHMQ